MEYHSALKKEELLPFKKKVVNLECSVRTLLPKKAQYTFFSNAHGTFSRIDHILGHKANFNKFRNTEIISCIFSDHNAMKLEINHRKINEKKTTIWRCNNMQLTNQ